MQYRYRSIIVETLKNNQEFLNFDLIVIKKILKIIIKNSIEILRAFNINKYNNAKNFFFKTKLALSIVFYQKNIERDSRAIIIYCIHRLEKIKTLYWSNKYNFTSFLLKKNLTTIELDFLQKYDKILTDYTNQVKTEINGCFATHFNIFYLNLILKKNLILIKDIDNIKIFKKKIRYYLPKIGIEKLMLFGIISNESFIIN
nr:hypothetical protein Cry52Nrm2_p103 [Cryptomonas curvata]